MALACLRIWHEHGSAACVASAYIIIRRLGTHVVCTITPTTPWQCIRRNTKSLVRLSLTQYLRASVNAITRAHIVIVTMDMHTPSTLGQNYDIDYNSMPK